MADNAKNLVPRLEKRGPHRVLVGELDFAGIPGRIYTPAEGKAIAGVAFGHDWRVGVDAYHGTLRHLASWGIAVAAPDTERGLLPNHRGFASDLESCLQILSGVRLGVGNITVDPSKLFFAGHGMGAGAAILAATGRAAAEPAKKRYRDRPTVAGVIAVHPSDTAPSCYQAARHVQAPGLVLAPGRTLGIEAGEPERVAALWGGEAVFRRIDKASSTGFHEKVIRKFLTTNSGLELAAQDFIRALMTGFVLAEDDKHYAAFRDPEAEIKKSQVMSRGELFESLPEFADPIDAVNKALHA
ncbi:MAG: alpha/beta hydrolase [Corynebacterium sp.]|uniref:alpha/beta hydrolase n=1 Tax=unclassified Corynebacterium TaxID=2624378 RepID=UPI00264704AF|nr:alpha/beta hydrolase [Corynebacterium sp.]MDN5581318.1 alpha/beta hydrolase [Corynebacterium sp.]MDN5719580.1 alpha/beta hydrolase [Corynebacterium sp.]MDN6325434.1 alpha/beta hydrolase [Corynebacterium sp.]